MTKYSEIKFYLLPLTSILFAESYDRLFKIINNNNKLYMSFIRILLIIIFNIYLCLDNGNKMNV